MTGGPPAPARPPRVSVVLCTRNGARTLPESAAAVLAQTFADFELILLDDASTDDTPALLASLAAADPRVRTLRNAENLGLTRSLNLGVRAARGEYIARIDDDDLMLPTRLEKQVAYLDRHPDVGVVGSHYEMRAEDGSSHIVDVPDTHTSMRWWMVFNNGLSNALVMMRRNLFPPDSDFFDPACRFAQEYDLWTRVAGRTRLAKIREVLTIVQTSPGRISRSSRGPQQEQAERISLREMSRLLGRPVSPAERADALAAYPIPALPATPASLAGAALALRLAGRLRAEANIDRAELHRLVRAWLLRMLNTVRGRDLADARRTGFLAAAFRAHPFTCLWYAGLRAAWILRARAGLGPSAATGSTAP